MGILKSLGAPDTRQTCFFRSFFVIDLFYIAKVTSFYGVLFLLWLTIEKTGILIVTLEKNNLTKYRKKRVSFELRYQDKRLCDLLYKAPRG